MDVTSLVSRYYPTPCFSPSSSRPTVRWSSLPTLRNLTAAAVPRRRLPRMSRLPADIVLMICRFLSVRDVLMLRCVNKYYSSVTRSNNIWYALLARLCIFHPVLPATSRHLFGTITPGTYEALVTRGIYLSSNWHDAFSPEADVVRYETHHEPFHMTFLPGGRYLLMLVKTHGGPDKAALVLFDTELGMALFKATVYEEMQHLKARFAMIEHVPHIVVACTVPALVNNKLTTRVQVFSVSMSAIEELSDAVRNNRAAFEACAAELAHPFLILHDVFIQDRVTDLDLADTEGCLILAVVVAPLSVIFTHIGRPDSRNENSPVLLNRITEVANHVDTAWKVKLLPWQNSFIVVRMLRQEAENRVDPVIFALDIYQIPDPGYEIRHPTLCGRQYLTGLEVCDFVISDLELSWFSAARNPVGLLNTPFNRQPPPISIYAITKNPSGVGHFVLYPRPIDNEWYNLKNGLGTVPQYQYAFPAGKVGRYNWSDGTSRARVLPGAYRSVVYMLPRCKPNAPINLTGMPVQRFLTTRLIDENHEQPRSACLRTTGCTHAASPNLPSPFNNQQKDEIVPGAPPADENADPSRPLRAPSLEHGGGVAQEMMHPGTTALAWDESTGKFVYAVWGKTEIRMLDFGKPVEKEGSGYIGKGKEKAVDFDIHMEGR